MALFNKNKQTEEQIPEPAVRGTSLSFSVIRREFLNLMTLNLIFILTCLPMLVVSFLVVIFELGIIPTVILYILTLLPLPASVTALSRITCTIVQDRNFFLWQDYMKSMKDNFFKALLGGFLYVLFLGLFGLAALVYYSFFGTSVLFMIIAAILAVLTIIVVVAAMYFWPMLAWVELPMKSLLKNSLLLVFGRWQKSFIALLLAVVDVLFFLCCTPVTLGKTSLAVDIGLFGSLLLYFSFSSLLKSFTLWPAIYDVVLKKPEEPVRKYAEDSVTKETLKWDEEKIESASAENLNWDED
ncbi:MAG: DUF624 domain-containing protein [Eubacteriales bacterium]|nr:DUF624 domain-containing protein [Eubacteriales bacterium]